MKVYSSDDYQGANIKSAALENPTVISTVNGVQEGVATSTSLTTEITARTNVDTTLTNRIAAEETTRASEITAAKARANHTGTQLSSTISDFSTSADARITAQKGVAGGLATLGADSKLNGAQMPDAATISAPTIISPIIFSPNINGILHSSGAISADDSIAISGIIADKAWTFSFGATAVNQKFDLYCSSTTGLESLMDVTVTTGVGTLSRRYSLVKQGTGIIQSGSRYTEVIGNISPYLAISDIEWDTTNQRWRFKIVNRAPFGVATAGSVTIHLVANTTNALTLLGTFGVSGLYTTDATTYAEAIYQFAGAISADALITNFIKKSVNYTATMLDSIIICTAGITITLPAPAVAGVGRQFTIKNTQNAGVTLVATGSAKIDAGTSVTIGNGITYTVISDGTQYWIISSYK